MGHDDRRRAVRVDCDLPIRLEGLERELTARIVDLSRMGLRMRMRGTVLGVHRLSSLVQVTQRMQNVLGDTFAAELHHEMLGSLIRRTLTPTRIAKRDWEHTDVEIGCILDQPLSTDEAGMLGVPLPAVGDGDIPLDLEGAGPQPRTPRMRRAQRPHLPPPEPVRHTAYVYPAPGRSSKPLVTLTTSLTRGMAILAVEHGQGWELPQLAVSDLIMALDAAYGTSIMLRIVDGESDLWAGPAEIHEVDVTPGSGNISLGVVFGRELRAEELGRLGLPTPA